MPALTIKGVAEVFGYPPQLQSTEAQIARSEYRCPFINSRCLKLSQHRDHDSSIPFGACSVWHKGEYDTESKPYVICPIRFTEHQHVFSDVRKLFSHRPQLSIQMVKELRLPGIGRIDQVLVQLDPETLEVVDFNILEIMACSTTSTGYVIKAFNEALQGEPVTGPLGYGINYRQVLSRMAVQALSKIEACEQWNAHMIWAVQDVLYDYMTGTTMLDLPLFPLATLEEAGANDLPALLLFIYSMKRDASGKFTLVLSQIRGGIAAQFAQVMRPRRTPGRDSVITRLRSKIANSEAVTLTAAGLVEIASELMDNEKRGVDL